MPVGVYQIKNVANGKRYVGESLDVVKRWQEHRRDLAKGNHHCKRLQADYKHYPNAVFRYRIRERFWFTKHFVNHNKLILTLLLREGYHMDKTNSLLAYNTDDTISALKMFADTGNNKRFAKYKRYRKWINRHIGYAIHWRPHILVASLYNYAVRFFLYVLVGVIIWVFLSFTSFSLEAVTNFISGFRFASGA